MSKSEKDIFQKFIKRVSEFRKSDLNQSDNEEYKNNIFKNNRINNYNQLNIDNINSPSKKKFVEFPTENKNQDKLPFSNNSFSFDNNSNSKNNLKNCLREYEFQNKNNNQLNNNYTNYTNPFINKDNYPYDNNESNRIELFNTNKNNYENNSSDYSNNRKDNIDNYIYNNTTPKILENSENINNKNNYSHNHSNKNNNNLNDKKKKEINYESSELKGSNKGRNKCKYLLIGFLGTYSVFIYLNKNEKFRKILKSNIDKINLNILLDYIKKLFEKIKSYKYISELKVLLNNGIDYLTKLFDGFNDGLRLISVFLILILFWYINKLFFKFVFKRRNKNDNDINKEDNIEILN